MATKQVEEAPPRETLKCKTWVLRVLIHCDGCKKKVKKVLQGIDGVYTTDVDSGQHKVTVTGNVNAETLIMKLERAGKFAEIWPEIKPPEKKDNKKSSKSKGVEKMNSEPSSYNEGCIDIPLKESNKQGHSNECKGHRENGADDGDDDNDGDKKKKKKNKNKNNNRENGALNNGGGEVTSKVDVGEVPSNLGNSVASIEIIGPSIQQGYSYPQMYYSPHVPAPPYGLSYNTIYPLSNASYYVAAPIMPMHAYNTPYPCLPPPPPSDPIGRYGYDDDDDNDDEYEGGCSIM